MWQAALADGWIGAFAGVERQAVLWFLVTGLVGMVVGLAFSVVERQQPLPWILSVPMAVVATLGVVMVPVSGFWLVLAVAVLGLVRSMGSRKNA